jgi:hypothetical protein
MLVVKGASPATRLPVTNILQGATGERQRTPTDDVVQSRGIIETLTERVVQVQTEALRDPPDKSSLEGVVRRGSVISSNIDRAEIWIGKRPTSRRPE